MSTSKRKCRNNTTFKLNEVRDLLKVSIQKIGEENWQKAVNHVIEEEQKLWELDNLMNETIEPLIINVGSLDEFSDLGESNFN